MKLNPITQRLYTDEGELIKQLHCPYRMAWGDLDTTEERAVRRCGNCQRTITDTEGMPDDAVTEIVRRDPSTCLKVSLNQDNVRVVHHDVRR